jgi:ornithine--oxo-acid transaminase
MLPYGDLAAIERAMNPNVAAVLVEPIQGESGIHLPPAGYLKGIEALCKKHNVLFVCDEIQAGLGRTGKFFCFQHEGVRPDIVIVGKALSGGFYPISAILADDPVMLVYKPGDHGSTFGGNPMAAAIAREALKVLVDEKMIENSAAMGDYFLGKLRGLKSKWIKELRGKGLWIGLELTPEAGGARRFCEALRDKQLLCKETHVHTIRFAPPLNVTKDELDWAFARIEAVFDELA